MSSQLNPLHLLPHLPTTFTYITLHFFTTITYLQTIQFNPFHHYLFYHLHHAARVEITAQQDFPQGSWESSLSTSWPHTPCQDQQPCSIKAQA
jgi:hypothetical protein